MRASLSVPAVRRADHAPRRSAAAALAAALLVVLSACGGSSESDSAQTDALSKKVAELEQQLDAATSTTAAPTTTVAPTTAAPAATAPPTSAAPAPQAVMPNVVCKNLQEAQDLIQAAGVFYSESFDATGAGRMQVLDANWVVVSQEPAPGTPISEGSPNLGAVKYGEPSPC